MNNDVMFSSKNEDWETPQWLYDKLNKVYHFGVDPCATKQNAKCKIYLTKEMDGLKYDWILYHVDKFGCYIDPLNVFMNPPYGAEIGKWIKKAYETGNNFHQDGAVVCLLPSRTDTKWFHDYCMRAERIIFIKGRLKFSNASNSAPFPSMIVVFKQHKNDMPNISSMSIK